MSGDTPRRRGTKGPRRVQAVLQLPFEQMRRPYAPIEVLSVDHVERIHQAALSVLRDVGMRVLSAQARDFYRGAGAKVVDERVTFDPDLVTQFLTSIPLQFALAARNKDRAIKVGESDYFHSAVGGPAYVMDNERGRRSGTYAEMCDYLRLIQSLNILHQEGGGPFEPMDLPANTRHLDLNYAQCTLLDKNWQPQTLGRARTLDSLEMLAISLGKTRADLTDIPAFTGIINTNSPLQLDVPMAEGLITLAEHGQVAVITPFTLAGAMSPVTIAGALTQQHAEALAGIVLTQIVRRGVPVMYGGFTSNVDMKSGAPAFGTPEYVLAAQASGQLARRVGVPFRSSNVTAANEVDAQAGYESTMSLWGSVMGGAHMINHAAGWMHGGLTASFEKLIIDADMLQMMAVYCKGIVVDEQTLALDAIREVGPAGHYFGAAHTMERYETAFYAPLVSTRDNHEAWIERGRITAREQAALVWKKILADYEAPAIDPGTDEALRDYVARRKHEGGAPMN